MRKNHTAILILVLFACASLVCAIDTKRLKFGNDKLRQLGNIRSEVLTDEINAQISCDFCLATVWTFRELLELNVSMTELESFLTAACVKANIKSFDKKVCAGAIEEFGDEVVLHISDLHYDPDYLVGSEAQCSEPLCCRYHTPNTTQPASAWGDYRCDIPKKTFQAFLQQISSLSPAPDVVFWTGDNTPHDIWEESIEEQLDRLFTITTMVQQAFPRTPVFPAMGNHDTFPVDQLNLLPVDASHYRNYQFLLNNLSLYWSNFIGQEKVSTFQEGGFYDKLAIPGLRIFAMNTFWGDMFNFYLLLKDQPQDNQWNYLRQVLTDARFAGEKVAILGHIPSGLSPPAIFSSYGDVYVNISREFSDVIIGHFYGHTHNDEFEIIFDEQDDPIGMSYLAPSCTTFSRKNPSYRIYDLDNNTFEILDYHQYYTDLSQLLSGKTKTPVWQEAYSAKSEYGMSDLSPSSWADLVSQFDNNDELFKKWYYHYQTQYNPANICEGLCKASMICTLKASGAGGAISCELK